MPHATTRQAGTRRFRIAALDATSGKPGSSSGGAFTPILITRCARAVSGASSIAFDGGNKRIDEVPPSNNGCFEDLSRVTPSSVSPA